MNDKPEPVSPPDRLWLRRWSRRKLEAARAQTAPARGLAAPPGAPAAPTQQAVERVAPSAAPALPPIESLTIDSEFAAFFKPEIPEATKRAALKQLFRDPRFNIMDGLDVYIDDYTQPDPIPSEMMARLQHTRHIFNPPKTEVNAEGHVVDVIEQSPAQTDAAVAIATPGDTEPAAAPPAPASEQTNAPDRSRQSGLSGEAKP